MPLELASALPLHPAPAGFATRAAAGKASAARAAMLAALGTAALIAAATPAGAQYVLTYPNGDGPYGPVVQGAPVVPQMLYPPPGYGPGPIIAPPPPGPAPGVRNPTPRAIPAADRAAVGNEVGNVMEMSPPGRLVALPLPSGATLRIEASPTTGGYAGTGCRTFQYTYEAFDGGLVVRGERCREPSGRWYARAPDAAIGGTGGLAEAPAAAAPPAGWNTPPTNAPATASVAPPPLPVPPLPLPRPGDSPATVATANTGAGIPDAPASGPVTELPAVPADPASPASGGAQPATVAAAPRVVVPGEAAASGNATRTASANADLPAIPAPPSAEAIAVTPVSDPDIVALLTKLRYLNQAGAAPDKAAVQSAIAAFAEDEGLSLPVAPPALKQRLVAANDRLTSLSRCPEVKSGGQPFGVCVAAN